MVYQLRERGALGLPSEKRGRVMAWRARLFPAGLLVAALLAGAPAPGAGGAPAGGADPPLVPTVVCHDKAVGDQDDMCIWVHPSDPGRSTIIASDKDARRLFVYDLQGHTIQSVASPHPANIDVRYGFPLGGKKVDIVALNQREPHFKIRVFAVDPETRRLRPVDDGKIVTGENYGGTLFHSPKSGKFYFITTAKQGRFEQWELYDAGSGKVAGRKVRSWKAGYCEAAVGDDVAGKVYIAEETKGVWEVGGEPDDPTPGRRVIRTRENGLVPDVEGLAIHPKTPWGPCLIVSSQGNSTFKVYRLGGDFALVGTFSVRGAVDTDGLDVTSVDLGQPFSQGLFVCHTGSQGRPVLLVPWAKIAEALRPPRPPVAARPPEGSQP